MLLPIVAGICLRLLAGIFFIQNKSVIISQFKTLGLAAAGLILCSVLAASVICLILRLKMKERRTIYALLMNVVLLLYVAVVGRCGK